MGVKVYGEEGLVLLKDLGEGRFGVAEVTTGSEKYHEGKIFMGISNGEGRVACLDGTIWNTESNLFKVRLLPKGTLLEVT